jgi:signal transduction histidine kinase
MSALTPADTAPAPSTALALTWTRMRSGLRRHFIVVGSLCLGIALLLTAMDGHGFGAKLVYSLVIGAVCSLIVDLTRLATAWAMDRRRAARREQVRDSPAVIGWLGAIPGALLAMVAGPPIGLWLADRLTGNRSASLLDLASSSTRVTLVVCLVGTVISIAVLSSLERLASARAQAEAAQRQAAEHQLRLLQSQLEPHMLFNTLANLRVLIGLDTAQAQAMLDRLIAYLRATLSASRLAAHPLATEFERIADYLGLMAVRMGPRLRTRLDLPDALAALPVPPLLLQPLVENAIKHGLEPHVQGGLITVSARAEGGELVLTVRDTGAGLPDAPAAQPGSRFGLAQVRERLATLHGGSASFALEAAPDTDGGTLATVRLPLPAVA